MNQKPPAFLILLLALLASAPSSAFEESADSYYARHMKSCQYKERENVPDLFAGFSETLTNECCAASVDAARADGGKFTDFNTLSRDSANRPDEPCPAGQIKKSLDCETSKHWCAPAK